MVKFFYDHFELNFIKKKKLKKKYILYYTLFCVHFLRVSYWSVPNLLNQNLRMSISEFTQYMLSSLLSFEGTRWTVVLKMSIYICFSWSALKYSSRIRSLDHFIYDNQIKSGFLVLLM